MKHVPICCGREEVNDVHELFSVQGQSATVAGRSTLFCIDFRPFRPRKNRWAVSADPRDPARSHAIRIAPGDLQNYAPEHPYFLITFNFRLALLPSSSTAVKMILFLPI